MTRLLVRGGVWPLPVPDGARRGVPFSPDSGSLDPP